jgi:hypothetical protein
MKKILMALPLIVVLSACSTTRMTLPNRAATEQLLISEAADAAALAIELRLPEGRRAFLDTTNFEGVDAKYAISAIRQSLLQQGNSLVEKREDADTIIEVRAGALSIDSVSKRIGVPSVELPSFFLPGATLMNRTTNSGIARFSLFAYDRASGQLIAVVAPVTGYSHRTANTTISVMSWSEDRSPTRPWRN